MTAAELVNHLQHFQRRVLQDALQEATAAYWLRRARQFEACRPHPGDHNGQASLEEMRDRWRRLTEIAKACRAKAEMALVEEWPEVDEVLAESWSTGAELLERGEAA